MTILILAMTLTVTAQESAVKGGLSGVVYDASGAVVPAAKVTIVGAIGERTADTNQAGEFSFSLLTPGNYSVKVEKQGFKVAKVSVVEVFTNRTSGVRVDLETGAASVTVEVTGAVQTVDTTSTAVSANLNDTFYQHIPMGRGVTSLFYAAAGSVSGLGTGTANPSISGGSGLENNYVADGVQINDAAFGGFGVFSRIFGSLGSGINLSFVKEVQVKTSGFEPQYGRSTGGLVQIVTKSGTSEYHGSVSGFFAPQSFESERLQHDDFGVKNFFGKTLHAQNYDLDAQLSGYVPGLKQHLFFFGSFNPAWGTTFNQPPPSSGLFATHPEINRETRTNNYSAKLTWKLNDSHSIEGSVFGDPTTTNSTQFRGLNTRNDTAFSKLDYGSRNVVGRYNGLLSPSWVLSAAVTWNANRFAEIPEQDVIQIADRTGSSLGAFTRQGLGFSENYRSKTVGFNVDTSKTVKFLGEHTFSLGYTYQRPEYLNIKSRSGGFYIMPATDRLGNPVSAQAVGQPTDAQLQLFATTAAVCPTCPTMVLPGLGTVPGVTPVPVRFRQTRGEFGNHTTPTFGRYHAVYGNDSWSINKHLTVNLGLRWEQQFMSGDTLNYTFVGNWSPRIGVSVDPWGDRKTKVYGNYARYQFNIPLDMAIRSLSTELDAIGSRWAPEGPAGGPATLNALGNPIFVPDAAHMLNVPSVSAQVGGGITPGTKMAYLDEWAVGFEHEFGSTGVIFSARYIDRRYKRIVEDIAGISPELFVAGADQNYLITNVNAQTDFYHNEAPIFALGATAPLPAGCVGAPAGTFYGSQDPTTGAVTDNLGNQVGSACWIPDAAGLVGGEFVPDGKPDGFPNPIRVYQAVEFEVNKSFSKNWMLRTNYRIAKLQGNFEGAFRNDNGQSDPSITSLFDFVGGNFNLLGDQFKPGVLNTDRKHVVNGFFSYTFDKDWSKGLTLGVGARVESGLPITRFKAHPAYENAGEIPTGGRGSLGRTPTTHQVDVKVDYVHSLTEKTRVRFAVDVFNLFNQRQVTLFDQNEDITVGLANADFLKPLSFQRPRYARIMVKFEF